MAEFSVRIEHRDFSPRLQMGGVSLRPERWGWAMPGGPDFAEIRVAGDGRALMETLNWLRCPVEIRNQHGTAVWWGYVDEVSLSSRGMVHRVGLAGMSNAIAVAYSYVEPGSAEVGERRTTTWATESRSVGEYGRKELFASVDGASTARAESVRDRMLGTLALPAVASEFGDEASGAVLSCRGWWQTLNWRYYANGNTAAVETTAQIAALVSSVGPFLAGVDVVATTGESYSEYQDGESLAGELVGEWLRGHDLAAWVTRERLLRIEAEGPVRWGVWPGRSVRSVQGQPVAAGVCPVGWAELRGDILAGMNLEWLGAPSPLYIEESSYDAQSGRLGLRPRGAPSAWELTRVREG